jgi:hypothetical protein
MSPGAAIPLYRSWIQGAANFLELLSVYWVKSHSGMTQEMTLMGHAGAWGSVLALRARVPRIRLAMEVGAVREHLDLRVPDRVALDEIELYAEVLSAVAVSDRPLTAEELDAVLGIAVVSSVSGAGD